MTIDYTKLTTDTGFAEYLNQSLNIRLPLLYKIAKKEGINSLNPYEKRELFAEYKNYLRQAKKTCFPEKQSLWTRVKQKLKQAASVFKEFPFAQTNIEKNAGNVDRIISDLFLNKGYQLLDEFDYKGEGKVYVFKSPSGKVLSIPHYKLLELKNSNLVLDFIDQSAEWTQKLLETVNFAHIDPEKRKEFFSLLTSGGERGSSKDIRDSLFAGTMDGLTLGAGQTIINAALNPAGVISFSLNPVRSYKQIKAQREQAKKQGDFYALGQIDGTNITLALLALKGGLKAFPKRYAVINEGLIRATERAVEQAMTEQKLSKQESEPNIPASEKVPASEAAKFSIPEVKKQEIEAFLRNPKKTLEEKQIFLISELRKIYKEEIASIARKFSKAQAEFDVVLEQIESYSQDMKGIEKFNEVVEKFKELHRIMGLRIRSVQKFYLEMQEILVRKKIFITEKQRIVDNMIFGVLSDRAKTKLRNILNLLPSGLIKELAKKGYIFIVSDDSNLPGGRSAILRDNLKGLYLGANTRLILVKDKSMMLALLHEVGHFLLKNKKLCRTIEEELPIIEKTNANYLTLYNFTELFPNLFNSFYTNQRSVVFLNKKTRSLFRNIHEKLEKM